MLTRSFFFGVLLVVMLPLLATSASSATRVLPPVNADVDYQLGGAVTPADNVAIVVRDRKAKPVRGKYNVCYVNAFQTQPEAKRWWKKHHYSLILKKRGKPVVDAAWGEWLLDIRTAKKRKKLVKVIGPWIDRCARDGFDAVEFDNLDSWTRSKKLIKAKHAKAYAKLLNQRAHNAGLATGQKNWAGMNGKKIGFDFAVAESCGRYRECGDYVADFGSRVIVIEYRRADFDHTCASYGSRLSIVLRDRNLTPEGVRQWC